MKLIATTAAVLSLSTSISAHGASSFPAARQWICSGGASPNLGVQWNGANGAEICDPAVTGPEINTVITDWSGVAQGAAGGHSNTDSYKNDPRQAHIDVMGGKTATICSGGLSKYSALKTTVWLKDQGDNVYPTHLNNGPQTFEYSVSAAHRTKDYGYIDVYVTKDGWDQASPVTWNSVEATPFCHYVPSTYPTPLQQTDMNQRFETYPCTIPTSKTAQHVIFFVWQRDDSDEAFYGCSDVVLTADGSDPTTTASTTASTTEGTTTSTTASTTKSTTSQASTTSSTDPCPEKSVKGPVLSDGTIRPLAEGSNICAFVDTFDADQDVTVFNCNPSDARFRWFFDASTGLVQSGAGNMCWSLQSHNGIWQHIKLATCDSSEALQKFDWIEGHFHSLANTRLCVGFDRTMEGVLPSMSRDQTGTMLVTMSCFSNIWGGLE